MKCLLCLVVLAGGCGSDPANVEGQYTIDVTNRDNGCNLANWTVGNSAMNIGVTINQQGANATADVTGGTAVYLDLVLGSHTFSGTVDGADLDLVLAGTRAQTTGNCTYTYDATILATLTGDALAGRINYTPASNGHSDCASIDGCVTYQDFNGIRPP
jgi:hypothetical protein